MRKPTMRQVKYKEYAVNYRGERWGAGQEFTGFFHGFTPDFLKGIIENEYGEIVTVDIKDFRFIDKPPKEYSDE